VTKRTFIVGISILIALYLNSVILSRYNIVGIRPDMILLLVVSLGVLLGGKTAGIIGVCLGLFVDIFFEKYVGLHGAIYLLAGVAGGLFYNKFYADNIIIPAAASGIASLIKENIMAVIVAMAGGEFSYPGMFAFYILPCALFTAGMSAVVHLVLKRLLFNQAYSARSRTLRSAK